MKPGDKNMDDVFDLTPIEVPEGVDRRAFLMRSAVISSAAVIAGLPLSKQALAAAAQAAPPAPARRPLARPATW